MGWLMRMFGMEHVGEIRGKTFEFTSYGGRGTYSLWSDALQACKDAGLYEGDPDEITVDGRPNEIIRWE